MHHSESSPSDEKNNSHKYGLQQISIVQNSTSENHLTSRHFSFSPTPLPPPTLRTSTPVVCPVPPIPVPCAIVNVSSLSLSSPPSPSPPPRTHPNVPLSLLTWLRPFWPLPSCVRSQRPIVCQDRSSTCLERRRRSSASLCLVWSRTRAPAGSSRACQSP